MIEKNNINPYSIIILAAGLGTRMKNNIPKLMHKLAEYPMIYYSLKLSSDLNPKEATIVLHPKNESLNNYVTENSDYNIAYQEEPLGTAHAVKAGINHLSLDTKYSIILYGDSPLITKDTITKAIKLLEQNDQASLVSFAFYSSEPNEYGRLIIKDGKFTEILEFKDMKIHGQESEICNSGIMIVRSAILRDAIEKIGNNNVKKEYYLTDIVKIIHDMGKENLYIISDQEEFMGANSQKELSIIDNILQKRIINRLQNDGVIIIKPETSYFAYDIKAKPGSLIYPNNFIGKNCVIGENAVIHSFSHLEGAMIAKNVSIGPFARVRPNTIIDENSRIGNFVEVKNSKIERNTKASHLSYIGDASLGNNVNIGAGTVICNYDGYQKHKAIIGNDVFIGSNTTLISPIEIENDSLIAAGSVVSKKVNKETFVITRPEEIHIEGKAKALKNKKLEEASKNKTKNN